MYCQSWLGIVPPFPPPPVRGATTSKTTRVGVWWPFKSVAFSRMMDPAQLRAGYGGFVQAFPPKEKILSPAMRSGETPLSFICWGAAHDVPDPYQAVIVAKTEFTFRSLSGSVSFGKRENPWVDWSGSIGSVDKIPRVSV